MGGVCLKFNSKFRFGDSESYKIIANFLLYTFLWSRFKGEDENSFDLVKYSGAPRWVWRAEAPS